MPTPQRALIHEDYLFRDVKYENAVLSGYVSRFDGLPVQDALFIRVEFILKNGGSAVFAVPMQKDGFFETAVWGDVLRFSLIVTDTQRCVHPDDVWTVLGFYVFP